MDHLDTIFPLLVIIWKNVVGIGDLNDVERDANTICVGGGDFKFMYTFYFFNGMLYFFIHNLIAFI